MEHRHLNHNRFTSAAIDDIITRGRWRDWQELREAALGDPEVLPKIRRICASHLRNPREQRYRFWALYADAHRQSA